MVDVQIVEGLLTRAEALAGAESVELPHVLTALSERYASFCGERFCGAANPLVWCACRSLGPAEDAAYYQFCVRLAAEPTPQAYNGYPAGSWRERLQVRGICKVFWRDFLASHIATAVCRPASRRLNCVRAGGARSAS